MPRVDYADYFSTRISFLLTSSAGARDAWDVNELPTQKYNYNTLLSLDMTTPAWKSATRMLPAKTLSLSGGL